MKKTKKKGKKKNNNSNKKLASLINFNLFWKYILNL